MGISWGHDHDFMGIIPSPVRIQCPIVWPQKHVNPLLNPLNYCSGGCLILGPWDYLSIQPQAQRISVRKEKKYRSPKNDKIHLKFVVVYLNNIIQFYS
jgi:hypothetical protein